MKFTVITLFPELIHAWRSTAIVGHALNKQLLAVETVNPRQFARDPHKSVDDRAFGGSDGMVMKFEPIAEAIESAGGDSVNRHVAFLSPQGAPWNQERANEWRNSHTHIVLVCGRYAGFDQRLIETYADEEISVGDYILNGGEVASLAVMESVARLLPGVLGNSDSITKESFANGLLEAPSFTRPRQARGLSVPSPLLSGNHSEIARFERDVSLLRTQLLRPDLIATSKSRDELQSECEEAWTRISRLSQAELASLGLSDFKGG